MFVKDSFNTRRC